MLVHSQLVCLLLVGILNLFISFAVLCCHLYSRSTSTHGCHLPTYLSNKVLLFLLYNFPRPQLRLVIWTESQATSGVRKPSAYFYSAMTSLSRCVLIPKEQSSPPMYRWWSRRLLFWDQQGSRYYYLLDEVDNWMGEHLGKTPAVLLRESGWHSCHQPRLPSLWLLYVDWISFNLNMTLRVFSRYSSLLSHKKSTHASRASRHLMPYRTHIYSSV